MSNNDQNQQNRISPPNVPLAEGSAIVYNIFNNCTFLVEKSGKLTLVDISKTETVNTKVTAEKIEGSAIGKGNKS